MATENASKERKAPPGADIVGGAGNQHNDWGHSDVGGNKQSSGEAQGHSRLDDVVGTDTGRLSEEAGELQTGLAGTESLSTGNAGSRQAESESQRNQ